MRRHKLKITAAFLLTVFTFNTVVSFACSVGLNMGYNKNHHEHSTPVHKHDKTHPQHSHKKPHDHVKPHSHDGTGEHRHEHAGAANNQDKSSKEERDCCSDAGVKFSELDKSLTNTNQYILKVPVVLLTALYTLFSSHYFGTGVLVKPKLPFVRSCLPAHTDLRIVIRSFQI